MGEFFFKAHKFLSKNRWASLFGMLVLFAGLVFLVTKIHFEEDITKLIPVNSENKDMGKVLKSVNFTDKIIVNIRRSDAVETEDLIQYANEFADSLLSQSGEYVKYLRGKINEDDLLKTMDFVYDNLPLFLDDEDYKTIANRIEADSINAITEANYRTLLSPSGIVSREVILKDPLGLSFIGLKKLRQLSVSEEFIVKDGFLISNDEKHILLFITPTYASSETAENGKFAEQLYALQDMLNSKYEGEVSSEYFGAALISVANANRIKKDIQFTVGITLTILMVILILFYRKIYTPLILFISPAFGVLLAIAFLSVLRTEISAISLGIGSILIGVTLDYSIHILTHIRNNESLEDLFNDIAEPILMSSLTTALAFLCLLFLDSQALQDLGVFAAVSVLGASVFALLFIPLVYKNPAGESSQKNFLDAIAQYSFHEKKWLLIVFLGLFIASSFTYNRVGFDKDINKLNFEPPESKEAMRNLDKLTDISSKSVYLATYGKSVEGTLQINDSIYRKLEAMREHDEINSFSSIGVLVHSKREQREKLDQWDAFWTESRIDSTQERLVESGNALGFKPNTFSRFYDFLEEDFQTLSPEDYQQVPSMLLEDYISTEADFTTITSLIKLNEADAVDVKTAFKGFPNTIVIDRLEMNETFLGSLKNDFRSLIVFCLLIVLGILSIFFRSFSLTVVTIIPIFLTWFITLGVMGMFGISFNVFNIIITTVIFGLGIDYSIFMTKGLLKELRTGEPVMITYRTSIMLSVLTTVLGIGVLIFAKHPALFSISIVSVIGIGSAMLTSFTIQPIIFKVLIGSNSRPPVILRKFIHSVFSFGYFGLGGILLSIFAVVILPILPVAEPRKKLWFHKMMSKYMKSVLYTNPFLKKRIENPHGEDFSKPGVIIANHTSFLDILAIGMLHPKICFLVNDWVYHSPIFGKAVQKADFYPVSRGIEKSDKALSDKIAEGYSVMAFPEGTRSDSNYIRRFHKGAFYLAEQFELDIIPVLIHGNSETNPKGSFIIDDGSLTLHILPRIEFGDTTYGENYSQQGKKVGAYFRKEFKSMRRRLESPTYFHNLIIREYRYKGNAMYQRAKADLNKYAAVYDHLMWHLDKNTKIAHFTDDLGELEFNLIYDGPRRKITTCLEDVEVRNMLRHSYLNQKYNRVRFVSTISEVDLTAKKVLVLSTLKYESVVEEIPKNIKTIVLLKEAVAIDFENIIKLGYKSVYSEADIVIFERAE